MQLYAFPHNVCVRHVSILAHARNTQPPTCCGRMSQAFDAIILHDGDFELPNLLLREVMEGNELRLAIGKDGFWRIVEPNGAKL